MTIIRPVIMSNSETNFDSNIHQMVTRKKLSDNPELKHYMVLTTIKTQ